MNVIVEIGFIWGFVQSSSFRKRVVDDSTAFGKATDIKEGRHLFYNVVGGSVELVSINKSITENAYAINDTETFYQAEGL